MLPERHKKTNIGDRNLHHQFLIIETLIFALPFFIFAYILYINNLFSDPWLAVLYLTIFILVFCGLIVVRRIFEGISKMALQINIAAGDEPLEPIIEKEHDELQNISKTFSKLTMLLEERTREYRSRVSELDIVSQLMETIGRSTSIKDLTDAFLEKAMNASLYPVGAVFLIEDQETKPSLASARVPQGGKKQILHNMESMVALVVSERKSMYVENCLNDSRFKSSDLRQQDPLCLLGKPVFLDEDLRAVLILAGTGQKNDPDTPESRSLDIIINSIGYALDRIQRQDAVEAQLRQLTEKMIAMEDDIIHYRQTADAFRLSEERYRTIIEDIEDSYYEVDLRGNVVFLNKPAAAATGYRQSEIAGISFKDFMDHENTEKAFRCFGDVSRTGIPAKGIELEIIRKDGARRKIELSISLIRNNEGKPAGFRGIGRDITEQKRVEEIISRMAYHDSLTGLPNRRLIGDRLDMAMAHAIRNNERLALMILDLDRFKQINDTLGHQIGDLLLQNAGNRLTRIIRKSDTAGRLGGDEFMLILPNINDIDDAEYIAKKILDAFREPFLCDGHRLNVTVSIGISLFPDQSEDAETLMRYADNAMYKAKARGRDNFFAYEG